MCECCAQVRAAAVFALGTFVNSVTERSEHANNIDQSVAVTLISTASSDMCPLVRKVREETKFTKKDTDIFLL